MPSFMDKVGSAASGAKWKADQQVRILKMQNNIHELENKVVTQTTALGKAAFELYKLGNLPAESLHELCANIGQLNEQIGQLTDNLHQIQAEKPPEGQAK
jgi:hypothetical protein